MTDKQIYDLNNMNVASQNVQLGTLLSTKLAENIFSFEDYSDDNDLANAILSTIQNNKIPILSDGGTFFILSDYQENRFIRFYNIGTGTIMYAATIQFNYDNQTHTWSYDTNTFWWKATTNFDEVREEN